MMHRAYFAARRKPRQTIIISGLIALLIVLFLLIALHVGWSGKRAGWNASGWGSSAALPFLRPLPVPWSNGTYPKIVPQLTPFTNPDLFFYWYPVNDICHVQDASGDAYRSQKEQERLAKVFERFKAVPDHRPGDTEETPRTAEVRFVGAVNNINWGPAPPFVLSLLVAGVPIELIGVNDDFLNVPFAKFEILEVFLDHNIDMKDSDVIVMLDVDVVFTGRDFMPLVQAFLDTTARSREEMDVQKIRAHQLRAPATLSTQFMCYFGMVMEDEECYNRHYYLDDQQAAWAAAHNAAMNFSEKGAAGWKFDTNFNRSFEDGYLRNTRAFLNSGSTIARLWALRELVQAVMRYSNARYVTFPEVQATWQKFDDDQSLIGAVSTELMLWEFKSSFLQDPQQPLPPGVADWRELTPFNLTPGCLGWDLVNELLVAMQARVPDVLFVNGHPMPVTYDGYDNVPVMGMTVILEYINNYTFGVVDDSAGPEEIVYRYLPKAPLARSPTGIPLANVTLVPDLRSNGEMYYRNKSLDGRDGAIDVSVPHASSVPLGLHYNAHKKDLCNLYHRLVPWVVPLYGENYTAKARGYQIDAAVQPQLDALVRLVANAPPVRMWRYNATAPDPGWTSKRSPMIEDFFNFSYLCKISGNMPACLFAVKP